MTDKIGKLLIFAVGAAVGSIATWKFIKTKYERIADEAIEDVKRVYSKRKSNASELLNQATELLSEVKKENAKPEGRADLTNYSKLTTKYNNEKEDDTMKYRPHTIPPEEFGETCDYDTISLTYYADGVLTDECDEIIEDVDDLIGEDSLNQFGVYEEDSVFVRNDELKTDYEILRDERNYSDVVGDSESDDE